MAAMPFFVTTLVLGRVIEALIVGTGVDHEFPPFLEPYLPLCVATVGITGFTALAAMVCLFVAPLPLVVGSALAPGALGEAALRLSALVVAGMIAMMGVQRLTGALIAPQAILLIAAVVALARFPRMANCPRWCTALPAAAAAALAALVTSPWMPYGQYSVGASSMLPTLPPGEMVRVNRLAYHWREPRRGEIAVFATSTGPYIKRIVALPGERVAINAGHLAVNGVEADYDLAGTGRLPPTGEEMELVRETVGDTSYLIIPERNSISIPEHVLASDEFFVLGDHRGNSLDSRFKDFGPVERSRFIGPVYGH